MKFKSQVYTQASGSIGGITYSRNKGGMYTRSRATPTNPNSTRQQYSRATFGGMVQMWDTLTDEQRQSWRQYAENTPTLDKLGEMIQLSGQQWFIAINSLRDYVIASIMVNDFTIGFPPAVVTDAPTIYNTGEGISAITSLTADGTSANVSFNFAAPLSEAGDTLLFVGRPQNVGRRFYKGPYQLAAVLERTATATGGEFNIADLTDPTDWMSQYIPDEGMLLPVRMRNIFDDGRASQPYEELILVGPPPE